MILRPHYFDLFRCKAGKCLDTCCKNWEIRIDAETYERYRKHSGEMKEKFRRCIKKTRNGGIVLPTKDGNCPFLNGDGLCEIYAVIGKDALCDICAEHPRFYDECDEIRIEGLGLCCEEAARLILSPDIDNAIDYPDTLPKDEELEAIFLACKVRTEHPEKFLSTLFESGVLKNEKILEGWIDILLQCEIRSEKWRMMLYDAKKNLPNIISSEIEIRSNFTFFCRLIPYFTLRHIFDARFFDSVEEGIRAIDGFIVFSICMICILLADAALRRTLKDEDKAEIAKLYSQEIEYDADLCERLEDPLFYCIKKAVLTE